MPSMERAIALGLELAKEAAGGNVALSCELAALGVTITPQAISQWDKVPAERVVEIEAATGVPRHLLRPDLHLPPRKKRSGVLKNRRDRSKPSNAAATNRT
jgi:DNA-binding transcriptional regulator YdaS (Cro superfamily)